MTRPFLWFKDITVPLPSENSLGEVSPTQMSDPTGPLKNPAYQVGGRNTLPGAGEKEMPITTSSSPTACDSNSEGLNDDGVNVATAEAQFADLNRQLSRQSAKGGSALSPFSTDPEKDGQDGFDLEGYLRGYERQGREAGLKRKQIGVVFENLTVSGIGGFKNYVRTFPHAFIDTFGFLKPLWKLTGLVKKPPNIDILTNFSGLARPGEMILVLGRPGSGCSSFLRVISNQRYGYTNISGDVKYGQFDAHTFSKKYQAEAIYNQEDDIHHPVLTVGQTLRFALDTKTPRSRLPGQSPAEFKKQVVDLLLKMFNIEHTENTAVGNAYMRGVSGGERKRVSIAETMITNSQITAWDNTTRGLDASTAYDYSKSLRIMTDVYQTVTFVSLYQASENIYKQFDKVMVIDEGREIFFGPIAEARSYFEGLGYAEKPRQTTPDYLTGCTDPFERQFAPGAIKVPASPADLEQAFKNSKYWTRLSQEIQTYKEEVRQHTEVQREFEEAVANSKRKHTSKRSVYTIPFYRQVIVLFRRQMILKWADRFTLVVAYATTLIIAIVLGSVYLNLPTTSAGLFTRGGILFISLLFNALSAFAELGGTMLGRPVMNKHRQFAMYRPGALWLAQIGVDMIFSSVQIVMYSIIVYFMCGLVRTAGAFFTFYIYILVAYMGMTLFFRAIGCICPDFDSALKLAALIITLFVLDSGYMIPFQAMQRWIFWIFYVDTFSWGFGGLMVNEFKNLNFTCITPDLIPFGPTYTDIAHRTCTLAGAVSGTDIVVGATYIDLMYNYARSNLWRNFGILVAYIFVFLGANVFLGEWVQFNAAGKTITLFKKENRERGQLNHELIAKRESRRQSGQREDKTEMDVASKCVLTWEKLTYDVPVKGGTLRLLSDVYGYCKPGQLTALMGASGAGKTTLLDVLAARKNIGVIGGDVLIDGVKPGITFQRGTAYCEQLDTHEPTQTVREALRFSAYLRQPYHVPQSEKDQYVEQVISLLEMEDIADAIIGDATTGLAVEERKRVTIGVELAAKPELLLFLDEPTSGLDSQSAFNIVRFLRKLAGAGQAIICTIHQPNSALFENFDRLLLLQKGGETVYFGDIGEDARILRAYLEAHGAACPPDQNVAEYMLEAIGAGSRRRIGDDWAEQWRQSDECAKVKKDVEVLRQQRMALNLSSGGDAQKEMEYATPIPYQLKVVLRRTNLAFWRSPNYGFTRLFNHIVIGLITGLAFLNVDNSKAGLQYRVFIMFQVTILPALILSQVQPRYAISRLIFWRESSSKMYSQFAFATSQVLGEVFYSILCAVGFFVCIYFPPGLKLEASASGYQFLMILITEFFSVTLGQMVASITPGALLAARLNPFIIITFSLFCGVIIPKNNLPKFWRSWIFWLDPFQYLISGMIVTELNDEPVVCKPSELNHFTAPNGQTCEEYAKAFLNTAAGYLAPSDGQTCNYCAYATGNDYLNPLGLSYSERWRNLGIFMCFIGSNLIILFVGSRYLKFAKR